MKCSHVALLVTLIFAGRTASPLAADEGTTIRSEQGVALRLACLETLWQAGHFQSPIWMRGGEPAADTGSPYDLYYANSVYCKYYDENCRDEDAGPVDADDVRGVKSEEANEGLNFGARLASDLQRDASWFAINARTAMGYAFALLAATGEVCSRSGRKRKSGRVGP